MFFNKNKEPMDMINGSMWKNILLIAIPLALTTLVQQFFHSVDMAVVGRFCGSYELAAVGSNGSIINLLVNIFVGFSSGSNVVIAQLIGGKRLKTARKAVHVSLYIALISGLMVMILGVIFSPFMLKLISSPPEVIDLATIYLRIYFIGIPPLMVYNFASAILRSRGETTKPFFCLTTGGIINVFLNLLFVIVFKWSVAGVAIATSLSNLVSCILILRILMEDKGPLGVKLSELKLDKYIFARIFKMGLPMSIQSCLFPMANMVVQSAINALGTTVMAACAAASSIEAYGFASTNGFAQSAVAMVSQNYGAKNIVKCKKAVRINNLLGVLICIIFNGALCLSITPILNLFTTDPNVAEIARERIYIMCGAQVIGIVMNSYTSALRGYGYSFVPTLISVVCVCGLRILWIKIGFETYNTLLYIMLVYPLSFIASTIVLAIIYKIITNKLMRTVHKPN